MAGGRYPSLGIVSEDRVRVLLPQLDERIIRGISWPAEVELHAVQGGQQIQAPRDEVWSVVDPNRLWLAMLSSHSLRDPYNIVSSQSRLDQEMVGKSASPRRQTITGRAGIEVTLTVLSFGGTFGYVINWNVPKPAVGPMASGSDDRLKAAKEWCF